MVKLPAPCSYHYTNAQYTFSPLGILKSSCLLFVNPSITCYISNTFRKAATGSAVRPLFLLSVCVAFSRTTALKCFGRATRLSFLGRKLFMNLLLPSVATAREAGRGEAPVFENDTVTLSVSTLETIQTWPFLGTVHTSRIDMHFRADAVKGFRCGRFPAGPSPSVGRKRKLDVAIQRLDVWWLRERRKHVEAQIPISCNMLSLSVSVPEKRCLTADRLPAHQLFRVFILVLYRPGKKGGYLQNMRMSSF